MSTYTTMCPSRSKNNWAKSKTAAMHAKPPCVPIHLLQCVFLHAKYVTYARHLRAKAKIEANSQQAKRVTGQGGLYWIRSAGHRSTPHPRLKIREPFAFLFPCMPDGRAMGDGQIHILTRVLFQDVSAHLGFSINNCERREVQCVGEKGHRSTLDANANANANIR